MSYYTKLPADKLWGVAMDHLNLVNHKPNRKEFETYLTERKAGGKKLDGSTLGADADEFSRFGRWVGSRSVRRLKREDVVAFFASISHKAEGTRYKTYIVLRAFFRWLHKLDEKETPPEFERFKVSRPSKKRLRQEDLITPEELVAMLRKCRDSQERFIIAGLYEAGPRAEELLSVDMGGVEPDAFGYLLRMPEDADGLKTGARPLRIFKAAEHLKDWLEDHQMRTDPDAPLCYSKSNRNMHARMGYQTAYALVKRVAKEAGIKKRVYPHLFRHTSATAAAKRGLDGQAMNLVYGWSDTSEQSATYVHLSRDDAQTRLLASWGVKVPKSAEDMGLRPLKCARCEKENRAEALFCKPCGAPLTPEAEKMLPSRREREMKEGPASPVVATTVGAWWTATAAARSKACVPPFSHATRPPSNSVGLHPGWYVMPAAWRCGRRRFPNSGGATGRGCGSGVARWISALTPRRLSTSAAMRAAS
ncbi:MAG: site-specific integrase [bacterium]